MILALGKSLKNPSVFYIDNRTDVEMIILAGSFLRLKPEGLNIRYSINANINIDQMDNEKTALSLGYKILK